MQLRSICRAEHLVMVGMRWTVGHIGHVSLYKAFLVGQSFWQGCKQLQDVILTLYQSHFIILTLLMECKLYRWFIGEIWTQISNDIFCTTYSTLRTLVTWHQRYLVLFSSLVGRGSSPSKTSAIGVTYSPSIRFLQCSQFGKKMLHALIDKFRNLLEMNNNIIWD